MAARGLTWSQLYVGQEFESATRTITEGDVVTFAGTTGDYSEVHVSRAYAEKTEFGERIAHGLLGLSMAHGLMLGGGLLFGTAIAFLGISDWSFKAPIRFGDTIHVRFVVDELRRRTKRPDQGVVTFAVELVNQHGQVVQSGRKAILLHAEPEDALLSTEHQAVEPAR
ncbi:MaoC/PaaZ C-terminal domain-containing protein [Amycolatopsis sp. CA-161197]|uniref:MaoC/PaaZ C-terminal domain-containing protein n=1 Tax=unclassified Amycolatopsis TaxID=2618356 RepID=UPI00367F5BD4